MILHIPPSEFKHLSLTYILRMQKAFNAVLEELFHTTSYQTHQTKLGSIPPPEEWVKH